MQTPIHKAAAEGFESASDAYDRGRPSYPAGAVAHLIDKLGITSDSRVLDLGAGTGKFTQLIFPTAANIVAVEPVSAMRKKLASLLPTLKILSGTAENIPLPDESLDAVVVAQAFHWFDGPKALPEIYRVLKSRGRLGLIWNLRDESVEWVSKLTSITDPYEKGAPRYKSGEWKAAFEGNSLFTPLEAAHFRHIQSVSPETVIDRIASVSFIAALPYSERRLVLEQVRVLVQTHPMTKKKATIDLSYMTDVFWAQKI
jgi:SAM-dependent methyltransferase